MNTPSSRRHFILLGATTTALGMVCPLFGQSSLATAATQPPLAESPEVAQLRRQLETQRSNSMRLLIALHAKHGAPITETIKTYTATHAQEEYSKRKVKGPRNLQAIKTELWDKLPSSFVWEIVEQSSKRLRFKVTKCPVAESMKKFNAPEISYALVCASDPGIAAGINPKILFTRSQTLMQGHPCCDHCYEMST
jgi:hypothetical protein